MKTLSYMYAPMQTIKVGQNYYFGQLWEGTGDGEELLESGSIAIYDEVEQEGKIVWFNVVELNKDILKTLIKVTDIF